MTHFDHNPLKAARHTRLIELQPRSAGDGLRCLLKTISIDEAPKYEALSYVWGLTTEGHSICVTQASSDRSGTLPITDNLYKALQWLRQEHEPRLLWIDAIVINQNDLEERMQQVSIMRDIYFRASHVVIWLGEASEDLGLIDKFGKESDEESGFNVGDYTVMYDPAFHRTLECFFNFPWFNRTWTLQEFSLARNATFIYPPYDMAMSTFTELGSRQYPLRSEVGRLRTEVERLKYHTAWIKSAYDDDISLDLGHLLVVTRSKLATDPRDKVYGLLGLVYDTFREIILPNYHLSVPELYTHVMKTLILHSGTLKGLVNVQPTSKSDLPSWVPDWRFQPTRRMFSLPGPILRGDQLFCTGGRTFDLHTNFSTQLYVHGLRFSKIKHVGKIQGDNSPYDPAPCYRDWITALKDVLHEPYPGDLPNGFLGTIASQSNTQCYLDALVRSVAFASEPLNIFAGDDEIMPPWISTIHKELGIGEIKIWSSHYTNTNKWYCPGRRFFMTESGHIGLAPAEAAIGDIACVIYGLDVPLIFRVDAETEVSREFHYASSPVLKGDFKNEKDLKEWESKLVACKFVGEAFVYGIMMGQALKQGLPDTWFCIT